MLGAAPIFAAVKPFPVVMGRNEGAANNVDSFSLPMPSGIRVGELLLAFVTGQAGTVRTLSSPPSGFTELYLTNAVSGNHRFHAGYYRQATVGDVGMSTLGFGASGGTNWAGISYRIFKASRVTCAAPIAGVDPPNLNFSAVFGVNGKLFLAIGHAISTMTPSPPSGMSNLIHGQQSNLAGAYGSEIIVDAAQYNPLPYTGNTGNVPYVTTLGVAP
jgi:hypothetical protein